MHELGRHWELLSVVLGIGMLPGADTAKGDHIL
jgi:hypothetical protein